MLFSPLTIRNVTLKNRIVMSPMCMYSAQQEDGSLTEWHVQHYVSRAVGQVGLIMIEATAVTPQGRISSLDLGIWDDRHIKDFSRLVDLIQQQGSKTAIQLAHAGRKATVEGPIIAPSAIPFDEKLKTPQQMSLKEVKETISAFKEAARRAKTAGFDIIEVHAAHGYLINQFLSPLTNHRQDEYGRDAQGRFRFLKEIIEEIREIWSGPLFVRVSASDYHPNGLAVEDYVRMAQQLKEEGVDLIDCSSGAVVPVPISVFPGYQVPFADQIKNQAQISTGAVGLITSGLQAEEILQNHRADLIFVARELLRDPYWPLRAAKELGYSLPAPKQYGRAW
ncbi:NADPH dehydrogenase NamA [Caldalkalibacillus mannanilyticus]|uniref:NADPH dehydrogenase NamA n=1 Tax=Caldalkalibacillus mannanilyticus TaxID=1418 RepID=UPI0005583247|nr:NADPH dehydrogenase NamA [Caldalkalibacillus mannanilyticus]